MPKLLQKALHLLTGTSQPSELLKVPKRGSKRPLKQFTERELIQLESEIGGQLFGEVPAGGQRKFFNLDQSTWIWYEATKDEKGKLTQTTTRYEIQGEKVLKVQDGPRYTYLEGAELENLLAAIGLYYERVMREIYHIDPPTGQKLEQ